MKNFEITLIPEGYAQLRGDRQWPRVPVTIYPLDEIHQRQVGYRFDSSGRSLITQDGWRSEWIVIGHEDLCGDPLIIDVSRSHLPVLTAAHGEGTWEPVVIARSVAVLVESLDFAEHVHEGNLDAELALTKIAEIHNEDEVDLEFWSILMEV